MGIGTYTPGSRLQVNYDINGASYLGFTNSTNNFFVHAEDPANGAGQSALSAFRDVIAANDGYDYGRSSSNSASTGYSFWGNLFSFGTSGFNYNDYTRCGGILGAQELAEYWGSLGYKDSGNSGYGGYFSSWNVGGGKSSQANTGIGVGAWGDLIGADIHGKIYGVYAEGENYAMFTNGPVYKNNLDVHLQENGTGTNTVLYTNVSTDITVMTSGYTTLTEGAADILFDPAFTASVSAEIPVAVTVTPVGASNWVSLAEVSKSGFRIVEGNGGKSSATVSFIAVGRRAGYEHPNLPQEVIDASYTSNMSRGLHNDADTKTNGEGLYYENGKLIVGIHPSTLPDPNKPASEAIRLKPATPENNSQAGLDKDVTGNLQASGSASPSGIGVKSGSQNMKALPNRKAIDLSK